MPSSLNGTGVTFNDGTTLNSAFPTQVQTFNSSGTWTKPAFGSMARIQVWGGGGGGARNSGGFEALGGGGGGYNEITVPLSTLGSSVSVTIAAGGTGRTGSNGDGTSGGDSSFGSVLSAYGGAGGIDDVGIAGGGGQLGRGTANALANDARPGAPVMFSHRQSPDYIGSPWHGGVSYAIDGAVGFAGGGSIFGGGAGGSADSTVNSSGGLSVYGGNGGAGGRATSGINGVQPGGGGGGRNNALNGGNGAAGRVVVTVW